MVFGSRPLLAHIMALWELGKSLPKSRQSPLGPWLLFELEKACYLFQAYAMAPGLWAGCQSPLVLLARSLCAVNNSQIPRCRSGSQPRSCGNKVVHVSGPLKVCELICQGQGDPASPSIRKRNPCSF